MDRLFIAEGESDTAALLSIGLDAIGRPGCRGGSRLVLRFVRDAHPREVVIVADADEAGLDGARHLARSLTPYSRAVRVFVPPSEDGDARAWVREGATASDVNAAVLQSELLKGASVGRRRA